MPKRGEMKLCDRTVNFCFSRHSLATQVTLMLYNSFVSRDGKLFKGSRPVKIPDWMIVRSKIEPS